MHNSNDYFTEIDLNPTINGAPSLVNGPQDRRAMYYFGFTSEGQQIVLIDPLPAGGRVLFSFDFTNPPGLGPIAANVQAHGAIDFTGDPAFPRYEGYHERKHVLVWYDGAAPAMGQQLRVRVSAWRKD